MLLLPDNWKLIHITSEGNTFYVLVRMWVDAKAFDGFLSHLKLIMGKNQYDYCSPYCQDTGWRREKARDRA